MLFFCFVFLVAAVIQGMAENWDGMGVSIVAAIICFVADIVYAIWKSMRS